MSTTTTNIDQSTLDAVQALIRTNLVSRDSLYAAADKLDGVALQNVCRRLADELGGHVADLQQLLLARGQTPVGPEDGLVKKLRFIVLDVLQQQQSAQQVVLEAEGREKSLKEEYDAAIGQSDDEQIKGLLHLQRKNAEFGGQVLEAIQEVHRGADDDRQGRKKNGKSKKSAHESASVSLPKPLASVGRPQVGDAYRCEKCGMRIEVALACNSPDAITPEFRCCGAAMVITEAGKANKTLTPEAERGDFVG